MYKYTSIKAVMNYLPDGLIEEWDESQIVKTALQGYRQNIRNSFLQYDLSFCISKVENHVAKLPPDVKGIFDISYSKEKLSPIADENTSTNDPSVYLRKNFSGETVTIFQALVFSSIRHYTQAMRYAGQSSDLVYNSCVQFLCQDCHNWSINRDLSSITLDAKEGYIYILYKAVLTDDDGDFLIPDDPQLLQALAYYTEAKHWQSRSFRKEENANNMFIERMQLANNSFQEFWSRHLLTNLDTENNIFQTQTINRIPGILFQRQKNIYR